MSTEGLMRKENRRGTVYYEDKNGGIVSKICSKCSELKLLDDFARHNNGIGSRTADCKSCGVKRSLKNYEANKKRILEASRQKREIQRTQKELELGPVPAWNGFTGKRNREGTVYYEDTQGSITAKVCTKCCEVKPILNYTTLRLGLGGRSSVCNDCRIAFYEANKESEIERICNWQRNNPEKACLNQNRRRARKRSLVDDITAEQMEETRKYFGGCALTGDSNDIHLDHVIPLATRHGGTTYGNMIPLRADLNHSKSDANIFEWFEANVDRYNLSRERFDRLIDWLGKANDMTTEEYRKYVYQCFGSNEVGSHSA